MSSTALIQPTLDDLLDAGTPLHEVTFVVVDLETTGASPRDCGITEIGAVRVRGGEVLGELQTFVDPGQPIPPLVRALTGITDAMVAGAPRPGPAVASFLEFARGAVLVAHNARFDIGFLKAACAAHDIPWPRHQVLDTVHLARQVIPRDEVGNHKLSTLARHLGATTTPDHRALHDARATVDVLHALIGRVGGCGVQTLEELLALSARVPEQRRRKRHLADGLPHQPGVYVFVDDAGRPLYVGTSRDIRTRVRSYFTASEQRRRIGEMVSVAAAVQPVVCATDLEAQVREVRLIAAHRPRYNRRSRHPERSWWLKLTEETFPRISLVRSVSAKGDRAWAGPFGSRRSAEAAAAALVETAPLRQCLTRLSLRRPSPACVLQELQRCSAPCTGQVAPAEYARTVAAAVSLLTGDARPVLEVAEQRMQQLADQARYEEAQTVRDRTHALLTGAARSQRTEPLGRIRELVAARRRPDGGWELVCVRHGRLAGASVAPRGADPMPYVAALQESAEVVSEPEGPGQGTLVEETELVARWLETEGTRVVHLDGAWTSPVGGAAGLRGRLRRPDGA